MAFPSPAADYAEGRVTPNVACKWKDSPAQFLVHANDASWRAGIKKDAVLVVNKARKPVDGSLVIVDHEGEFEVKRLKTGSVMRLESLDNPEEVRLISSGDLEGSETIVWGVVTHIINDACTEEFDDCPLI
ncbi:S24 family peptidase [Rouxiella chamberiensis]|uniref:DNA polymerase V n=1 Tax=Rouxiella chamberiensis TaxID=1513468 RepID=A0ABY7HQ62_9GAMM|nr:S24 family peptidase [Rouxiella chamberiensis]WAT01533.1 DNA polymerase V [Rouxiella chamberiensis]